MIIHFIRQIVYNNKHEGGSTNMDWMIHIPKKEAERISNHLKKAQEILRKYNENAVGGMVDCFCDVEIAQDIQDHLGGFETMIINSKDFNEWYKENIE
jgi:hypothetical protein